MLRTLPALALLLVASAAAAQSYSVSSQPQTFVPMTGGTSLVGTGLNKFNTSSDDDEVLVPIGFTFPFYGGAFTQVLVSSNGFITFDTAACGATSICADGAKIPMTPRGTGEPHNFVAPWWDDLRFDTTTQCSYRSTPTQFDLEWLNIKPYSSGVGSFSLSMRVTLFSTGQVQVAYGTNGAGTGSTASVGYENGTGMEGASFPLPPMGMPCSSMAAMCTMANWPANTLYTLSSQVEPDLLVQSLTGSLAQSGPGLAVTANATFRNLGDSDANGFTWKVWLSTDVTLSANDFPVVNTSTPLDCAGHGMVSDSISFTTATPPPPGYYFILAQVDADDVVNEAFGETNNVSATATNTLVGIDLVAAGPSGPAVTGPGNMLTANVRLSNSGSDSAGPVTYEIRLSLDTAFSANDFLLYTGTRSVGPGEVVNDPVTLAVPLNVPPGDFYYLLRVDPLNAISEAIETNNVAASLARVTVRQADLVAVTVDFVDASTFAPTRSALFGQPGRLRITVRNDGGATARDFRAAAVISNDANLSLLSDTLLAETAMMTLDPGITQTFDIPFTIPLNDSAGVPFRSGNYFFYGLLDSRGGLTETNEGNNNVAVGPVVMSAPAADLVVTLVEAPSLAGVGELVPVHRVLRNAGPVDAAAVRYRYVLSANQTASTEDLHARLWVLGAAVEQGTVQLASGQADVATELVQVPGDLPPGTWFIGCVLDTGGAVPELDESNNGATSAPVIVAPSSLAVATPGLPDAVIGVPYLFLLSARGELPGSTTVWSVDGASGALPDGLTLNADGRLGGRTAREGIFAFTAVATNSGRQATARFVVRVLPVTNELTITTGGLPPIINDPALRFEHGLGASGGVQPYQWGLAGGALPLGITLSPDGSISGYPRAGLPERNADVVFLVRDAIGAFATRSIPVRLVAPGALVFVTSSLPDGMVGVNYGIDVVVQNGDLSPLARPLIWRLIDGELPVGLDFALEQDVALLAGTPAVAGASGFTVEVEDARGRRGWADFTVRIHPTRLRIGTAAKPERVQPGADVDFRFVVAGNPRARFSLFAGALPPGLTLAQDGRVTGTVATEGTEGVHAFTVEADDPTGATGLGAYAIEVKLEKAPAPSRGCSAAPSTAMLWLCAAVVLLARRTRHRRVRGM